MKKLLILVFPIAFLIGLLPYFFSIEETKYASTIPQVVEKHKDKNDIIEKDLLIDEFFEEKVYEAELLFKNNGIIENATVLTNEGIKSI